MHSTMIRNGIGCERDSELESGMRINTRTFMMDSQERRELPLGLSASVRHHDFISGDLMSEKDGRLAPFSLDLHFAGILYAVGQNQMGDYVGSIFTRGIVVLTVEGVSVETRQGTLVYATPTEDRRCRFTVDAVGLLIGEVTNIEVRLSGNVRTHVGLRLPGDVRRYTAGSMLDPFKTK